MTARGRVRHQDHVGLIDALPAGDRRTVEHLAVLKEILVNDMSGYRYVLLLADRIGETKIDKFDLFFFDKAEYLIGLHESFLRYTNTIESPAGGGALAVYVAGCVPKWCVT